MIINLVVDKKGNLYRPCEKCSRPAKERHHIVYTEYSTVNLHIAFLCCHCHKLITNVNTKYAKLLKEKLTDLKRLYIWGQFIQDKIHLSWSI